MGKIKKKNQQTHFHPVLFIYFLLVAVYIVGIMYPGYASWGIQYLGLMGESNYILILLVSLLLILTGMTQAGTSFINKLIHAISFPSQKTSKIILGVLLSGLLFSLFYLLRVKTFIYGDGYLIASSYSDPSIALLAGKNKLELLTVALYYLAINGLSSFGWQAERVIQIVNCVGGVVGIMMLWKTVYLLREASSERLFIFLTVLGSGGVLLFFGYVENYTWALVISIIALNWIIRFVKDQTPIWIGFVWSVVAILFHVVTFPILLLAILAYLLKRDLEGKILGLLSWQQLLVVAGVVSVAIATVFQLIGSIKIFVPVWPTEENPYFALHWQHIIDLVNLTLLIAPIGGLYLVYRLVKKEKDEKQDLIQVLLLSYMMFAFIVSFWLEPNLGAVRDWDFLSFYWVPLGLWGGYRLATLIEVEKRSGYILLPLAMIVLIVVPNLYEKNHPEPALEHMDRLLAQDIHYSTSYERGYRGLSWGFTLLHVLNRNDLAKKYYERRIEGYADDFQGWNNLGQIYLDYRKLDSAKSCFMKAHEIRPEDFVVLNKLSQIAMELKQYSSGLEYAKLAYEIDTLNVASLTQVGIALAQLGEIEEAISYFRNAFILAPEAKAQNANLGIMYSQVGKADSALYYLDRGVARANGLEKLPLYYTLLSLCVQEKQKALGERYLHEAAQFNPSPQIYQSFKQQIEAL